MTAEDTIGILPIFLVYFSILLALIGWKTSHSYWWAAGLTLFLFAMAAVGTSGGRLVDESPVFAGLLLSFVAAVSIRLYYKKKRRETEEARRRKEAQELSERQVLRRKHLPLLQEYSRILSRYPLAFYSPERQKQLTQDIAEWSRFIQGLQQRPWGTVRITKDMPPEEIVRFFQFSEENLSNLSLSELQEPIRNLPPCIHDLGKLEQELEEDARQQHRKGSHLIIGNPLGRTHPLVLSLSDRFRHCYIIGKTGSGKSTLLRQLIQQDLKRPHVGVVVLSPESDLFETLLAQIPPERAKDLIYFDPTDTQEPVIGFNPFRLEPGEDLTQKAEETYTIFERALGELGVKMTTVLQNAVYALLQHPGSTLRDLDRLLNPRDPTLRREIVTSAGVDERTHRFWQDYQSSGYYKTAYEPVVNRLDAFFRPPLVEVLSTASFAFHEALNLKPHILFYDLSKLRGIQAQVVGQLLLAQLQQTLLRRDEIPEDKRIPTFFYIDEFQTYATASETSLVELFNRARKYKMGVTLAHQVTADIPAKLLSVIVGNVGTLIALHLAAEDAPFFAKELQLKDDAGHLRPDILQNLSVGKAVVRTPQEKQGLLCDISFQPTNVDASRLTRLKTALKTFSKQNFGRKRAPQRAEAPPIPAPPSFGEKDGKEEEGFKIR